MKCLKCGAYIYSSDKFCRNCGTTLTKETCQYGDNIPNSSFDSSSCHEKQYNYSYTYSNKTKPTYNINASHQEQYDYNQQYSVDFDKYSYAYKPNDSGADKYLKAFIGKSYNHISKMSFSFSSLLFGPLYLIHRKLWQHVLIIILFIIAAIILLPQKLVIVVLICINIFYALKFPSIYIKYAENKTEMIQQQNLDKSTTELLELCKKKGGTFKHTATLIILPLFLCSLIIPIILMFKAELDYLTTPNIEIEQETSIKQFDNLTYELPIYYFEQSSSITRKKYKSDNITQCGFIIDKLSSQNNTIPDLLGNTYNHHPIIYKTINNNLWYYVELENTQNQYIYAHQEGSQIYRIIFENPERIPICTEEFENFTKTLNLTNQ